MSHEYSLNEKIGIAFRLSSELADLNIAEELELDSDDMDLVYGHADGLSAKRLYDIRDGRCSLAMSMAFDPEAEEKTLDDHIAIFKEMLENAKND